MFLRVFLTVLFLSFSFSWQIHAQEQSSSFNSFFSQVLNNSKDLQAVHLDIQALNLEIQARDIELSAVVDAGFSKFWDNQPSLSSNIQSSGKIAEFGLSKPFASGTEISLLSSMEDSKYRSTSTGRQHLLNWQIGVSQSLWQNRFGRQTSLRRQKDAQELKRRFLALILKQQQLLVEYESLYWDIVYAQQELNIRNKNLERSQKILDWTLNRFNRFAAEEIDVLQAKTLVLQREIDLQEAKDQLETLKAQFQGKLDFSFNWVGMQDELNKHRALSSLIAQVEFAPQAPVLIETLQAQWETKELKTSSKLEVDKLKPDLKLNYFYGLQGQDPSYSTARRGAFSSKNDYQEVGLSISMPLDFSLISKTRQSLDAKAQAQEIRWQRFNKQSIIYWDNLVRTVASHQQIVEKALALAQLQIETSDKQKLRYERGKATAFEAISFEQDAADAQLLALKLMYELRLLEIQARLYIQGSS